jgi:D-alanyl-lipoteichoic acid acyltransferase DltB (MBOAT superfamily)
MRKTTLLLASIFTVLGIVFSFLPLGTLALIPIILALIFSFITFSKSENELKQLPKMLLLVGVVSLVFVVSKQFFVKDEVAVDKKFEQTKQETKAEAKKELEEIEGL